MAKSIKLQNNNYFDSSGIVYKKTKLNNILEINDSNEVEIGTWYGKSLYRKTYKITNSSGVSYEIDVSALNIDTLFFNLNRSFLKWNLTNRILPILSTNIANANVADNAVAQKQTGIYYNYSTKKIVLEFGYQRLIYDAYLTIEYTKA